MGAERAGGFEDSSSVAVEVAGPGVESTAKADINVPVTVSPAALWPETPTESVVESLKMIADGLKVSLWKGDVGASTGEEDLIAIKKLTAQL